MKFNGRNIHISSKARIGTNVKIGDNTIVYDNVVIGDDSIICNDCILGEPLNSYYYDLDYENPELVIGKNSLIRSHSIFYAGSRLGDFLQTGHRVTVREYTNAGEHCSFGSYTDIQGYCKVGSYVRMHSFVNIGQKSEIGDYVFFYPFSILTNDPVPPSNILVGAKIGDYSQIATGVVILPGASVGANCLIGANSTVDGDFPDDSFIVGNPAKRVCQLSKAPLFDVETKKRHYPWQYNFKRGMPWEKEGFDAWIKKQKKNIE